MILAKVIGTIWATRKYDSVKNYKLQFIQPIDAKMNNVGDPIVAVDTIGAGPGEIVFYATSSESVIAMDVDMAPVDASIVGIVDSINSKN